MTPHKRATGYALVVVPATLGAVLNAPWAATLAVVFVALFLGTRAGVLRASRDHLRGFTRTLVLAPTGVALGIVAAEHLSSRFFGLVAAGWIVVADIVARVWPDDDGSPPPSAKRAHVE